MLTFTTNTAKKILFSVATMRSLYKSDSLS